MLHSTRRTLVQALMVSLLVHAVLLLGVTRLPPVRLDATVATINVVVNRDDHRGDPVKSADVPATKRPAAPVKPVTSSVRKTPEQTIIATDQVADTHVAVSTLSSVPEPAGAVPAPLAATVGGENLSAPKSATARDGVNADDLSQYHLSLLMAARRLSRKSYPPLAKERGWEGAVEVVVTVTAMSRRPEVTLVRSSGRSVLDDHALELMTQAARTTSLPEGLKGQDFRDPIEWKFSLEDDQ